MTSLSVVFLYQETCLKRISEGLQLHRALLAAVAPRLKHQDQVTDLQADVRDLIIHINKVGAHLQSHFP